MPCVPRYLTCPVLLNIGLSGVVSVADDSELLTLALSARLALDPTVEEPFFFTSIISIGFDSRNKVTMITLIGTVIKADITAT